MAIGQWTSSIIGLICMSLSAAATERLPRLHALTDEWTVSGLSAGAYMASQVAVAHSRQVRGVGVFAGGPFYCVGIDQRRAQGECLTGAPAAAVARREAERLAALRLVDPVDGLAAVRAWVVAGAVDPVIAEPVVRATAQFFSSFNASGTVFEVQPGLGHGLPTLDFGVDCGATASPFINRCGVPAVARMLEHLLPAAPVTAGAAGRLLAIDQDEFVPALRRFWKTTSLDSTAYVFVPQQCGRTRCRVHVALHGCRQGAALVGDAFARHAEYNEWAAARSLIVLYPQVRPVEPSLIAWWLPRNPHGCWDWWGYTGPDYATRNAVQITAIVAMVARLGEKP